MISRRGRLVALLVGPVMLSTAIGLVPASAATDDTSAAQVREELVAARESADRAEQRQAKLKRQLKAAEQDVADLQELRDDARSRVREAEAERVLAAKRARKSAARADKAEDVARAARAKLMRLARAGYAGSLSSADLRIITDFVADGSATLGDFARQALTSDRVQDRLIAEAAASAKAARKARELADMRKLERKQAKAAAGEAKRNLARADAQVRTAEQQLGELRNDARAAKSAVQSSSKRYLSARASFKKAFLATCSSSSQAGGSGSAPPASAGSQADIVWSILLSEGFTEEAAAGVLGNLQQESGVDPTARQSGGPGRGLAQWSQGGRWDSGPNSLLSFAGNRRIDPWDAVTQTKFMLYEMSGSWGGFDIERFRKMGDITEAVKYFHDVYERSADSSGFVTTIRAGYGMAWYSRLTGSAPVKTLPKSGEPSISCP